MGLRSTLKAIWDDLKNPYGEFYPSPEVKAKLEAKGYTFEDSYIVGPAPHGMVIPAYNIYSPRGEQVGWPGDYATEQYLRDYARAVAECEAEKNKPDLNAPQPKP